MKKGQAALEFLMTYGWAILVVFIVMGALAYFGALSQDKLKPNRPIQDQICGSDDDCQHAQAEFWANNTCSKLVNLSKGVHHERLYKDITALEKDDVVVDITADSIMWRYETEINYETDARFLLNVECRTPMTICPRDCNIEERDGCFCYNLYLRSFIYGDDLDLIMYGKLPEVNTE